MKKYLLGASLLTLVMASPAMAVDPVLSNPGVALLNGTVANINYTNQDGNTNAAGIYQFGIGGYNKTTQKGNFNKDWTLQVTSGNSTNIKNSYQNGVGNEVVSLGVALNNSTNAVNNTQLGNFNTATIVQSANNDAQNAANNYQKGFANESTIMQFSDGDPTLGGQGSISNFADVRQDGTRNKSHITQWTSGSNSHGEAIVRQNGNYNETEILQVSTGGADSEAIVRQNGNYNSASVVQFGTQIKNQYVNISQKGYNNRAVAVQSDVIPGGYIALENNLVKHKPKFVTPKLNFGTPKTTMKQLRVTHKIPGHRIDISKTHIKH